MKRTLDQIRASVALKYKGRIGRGQEGGEKIRGFPTMIQNNGLLGALAYAVEMKDNRRKNHQAEYDMAGAIADHLDSLKKENYSLTGSEDIKDPDALSKYLSNCSPADFRRVNAEVIAFLNYLRRFAS